MTTVNVIHAPDPRSLDMLVMPPTPQAVTDYLQNNIANISDNLLDAGRSFMEAGKQQYRALIDSSTLRAAKNAIRSVVNINQPNSVHHVYSLYGLRTAQGKMQRYIMAEPSIRDAYLKQRIDGYSDSYEDVHHGAVLDDHYDYRRVMHEMVTDTDDGWYVKSYSHATLGSDDDELTIDNRADILNTWEFAKMCLEAGDDPTDILLNKWI